VTIELTHQQLALMSSLEAWSLAERRLGSCTQIKWHYLFNSLLLASIFGTKIGPNLNPRVMNAVGCVCKYCMLLF